MGGGGLPMGWMDLDWSDNTRTVGDEGWGVCWRQDWSRGSIVFKVGGLRVYN